jgi:hypothetical protein
LRLFNLRFTDWSQGTHYSTHADADNYLTLEAGATSGYWETEVDLADYCFSSIKTVSRLHPKALWYYPNAASDAATDPEDIVNTAVSALRRGDMAIINCPIDPSTEMMMFWSADI